MFCGDCGRQILDGKNFCTNCGARVEIEWDGNSSTVTQSKKKKFWIIAASSGAVLALLVFVIVHSASLSSSRKDLPPPSAISNNNISHSSHSNSNSFVEFVNNDMGARFNLTFDSFYSQYKSVIEDWMRGEGYSTEDINNLYRFDIDTDLFFLFDKSFDELSSLFGAAEHTGTWRSSDVYKFSGKQGIEFFIGSESRSVNRIALPVSALFRDHTDISIGDMWEMFGDFGDFEYGDEGKLSWIIFDTSNFRFVFYVPSDPGYDPYTRSTYLDILIR